MAPARLPGVAFKPVRNGGRAGPGNNFQSPKRHQRKRGHPDPGAKIIALTPEQLKDSASFPCELCNDGFECERNLLVHDQSQRAAPRIRKKRSPRQKKAYICPVDTCRFHDERCALSDVTAMKKHFGRKHGSKALACTRCDKKYAVAADLKAHFKHHHMADVGAVSSDPPAVSAHGRPTPWREAAGDAAAGANDVNGHGSSGDDGITRSLGVGKQQEDHVPQFGVAPDQEGRERGHPTMNMSATLDMELDLTGHLPMGLTGLLTGNLALGHHEAPIAPFAHPTPAATTPPASYAPTLFDAGDLRTPQMFIPPSKGDNSFAAGFRSRQGMSTPSPSFSSCAPFFGPSAVPVNSSGHSMGGGSSDGFGGFFAGSANRNQGSWGRDTNGVGSFDLNVPPVSAPQQPPMTAAPGNFSYASMLGAGGAGATVAASEMDHPCLDLRLRYAAPPTPPPPPPPPMAPAAAPELESNKSVPVLIIFFGGE